MVLSHAHNFIVLKRRKIAGRSVEFRLGNLCALPDHTPRRSGKKSLVTPYGIIGAPVARAALSGLDYCDRLTAAYLRDRPAGQAFGQTRKLTPRRIPFDLAVSALHRMIRQKGRRGSLTQRDVTRHFPGWMTSGQAARSEIAPVCMIDDRFCADRLIRHMWPAAGALDTVMTTGADRGAFGLLPRHNSPTRPAEERLGACAGRAGEARIVTDAAGDFELFDCSERVVNAFMIGQEKLCQGHASCGLASDRSVRQFVGVSVEQAIVEGINAGWS